MGKKITWIESTTTYYKYSAKLTDEQAKLFEEDEDKFFSKVDFRADANLEWEDEKEHESEDFELESDN
jgi:hypothetical protein